MKFWRVYPQKYSGDNMINFISKRMLLNYDNSVYYLFNSKQMDIIKDIKYLSYGLYYFSKINYNEIINLFIRPGHIGLFSRLPFYTYYFDLIFISKNSLYLIIKRNSKYTRGKVFLIYGTEHKNT